MPNLPGPGPIGFTLLNIASSRVAQGIEKQFASRGLIETQILSLSKRWKAQLQNKKVCDILQNDPSYKKKGELDCGGPAAAVTREFNAILANHKANGLL